MIKTKLSGLRAEPPFRLNCLKIMNMFALASVSRGDSVMLPPTSRVTISISTYSVITAPFKRTRNSIPAGLCIAVPDFQT